jgi:hypothetical protein
MEDLNREFEGKRLIFCKDCLFYFLQNDDYSSEDCLCPTLKKIGKDYHGTWWVFAEPKEVNKNNDCKYFRRPVGFKEKWLHFWRR